MIARRLPSSAPAWLALLVACAAAAPEPGDQSRASAASAPRLSATRPGGMLDGPRRAELRKRFGRAASRPAIDYRHSAPEIYRSVQAVLRPTPDDVHVRRDLVYRTVVGSELALDVYEPASRRDGERAAAIMYIHGGGWALGDKRRDKAGFVELARHGFVVCSINYRLTGEARFPACIEDCKVALRWMRHNAAALGVDPQRIGVMGASAGAHLAALLAVAPDEAFRTSELPEQDHAVRAVVALYGVYELRGLHESIGSGLVRELIGGTEQERPDAYRTASPIAYVKQFAEQGRGVCTFPPFLFIHGDQDRLVWIEASRDMHRALQEAGCDSGLIEVRGGVHGLMIGRMDPPPDEFRRQIAAFFDRHLR